MSDRLDFSAQEYSDKAKKTKFSIYTSTKENQPEDAFMLCLKELPPQSIDVLCEAIQKHYKSLNLTSDECYKLTQGHNISKLNCDQHFKQTLLELAYDIAHTGKTMSSTPNTSEWLNEALYIAEAASQIASMLNLDPIIAQKLGILHHIGKKFTPTPEYTVKGFEYLIDQNWEKEATICLTAAFQSVGEQAFCQGNRFACTFNPPCEFHLAINGNTTWEANQTPDDVSEFLNDYIYSGFDKILNIAVLMATPTELTTPYNTINNIPDHQSNKTLYATTACNNLISFLMRSQAEILPYLKTNPTPNIDLEEANSRLKTISEHFSQLYNQQTRSTKINLDSNHTQKIKNP